MLIKIIKHQVLQTCLVSHCRSVKLHTLQTEKEQITIMMWHPWSKKMFLSSAKPFTLRQQILLHFSLLRCKLRLSDPFPFLLDVVIEGREPGSPAGVGSFSRTWTPCLGCSITPQASPSAPPITTPAPLFTTTCIREDKLPRDHSGLLQFGHFFCRDEATVELVAQAEGCVQNDILHTYCSVYCRMNAFL